MRIPLIILFLLIGIVYSNRIVAQQIHIDCDTAHFHYSEYIDSMAFYEKRMGEKKHLNTSDERLTLAFYVALSHYPELHDKRISLRLKPLVSTMQAHPSPNFIIKRKSKRSYRIFVNDNPDLTGLNYEELSFNGLVGWIGHEFAHLIDYSSMNNRELLGFIAAYVFDKREMRKTERQADKETIKRGLGIQLLDGVTRFLKRIQEGIQTLPQEKKEELPLRRREHCRHQTEL